MISTVTILVLIALAAPSLSKECKCRPALKFRGDGTTQYGISKGSPKILKAFTACFWLSVPKDYLTGHQPTQLSYATKGAHWGNDILINVGNKALEVRLNNKIFRTGVTLADRKLHHVCVTWQSSSGLLEVFKDGVSVKKMEDSSKGDNIKAGGTWVIGQDQDSVGGGFHRDDSFKGILTEVHVWSRVLCPAEISRVAEDCGSLVKGDYKTFSDFIPSAAVEYETTKMPCCPKMNAARSFRFFDRF